jgi:hypothetical protein
MHTLLRTWARAPDGHPVPRLHAPQLRGVPGGGQDVGQQHHSVVIQIRRHLEAVDVGWGRLKGEGGAGVSCSGGGALPSSTSCGQMGCQAAFAKAHRDVMAAGSKRHGLARRLTKRHSHVLRLAPLPSAGEVRVAEESAAPMAIPTFSQWMAQAEPHACSPPGHPNQHDALGSSALSHHLLLLAGVGVVLRSNGSSPTLKPQRLHRLQPTRRRAES